MLNLLKIIIPLLLILNGCASESGTSAPAPARTADVDIPALLPRAAAIQYGTEWEQVNKQYTEATRKLAAEPADDAAYLSLIEVFINEARVTGEHGHYYPAALRLAEAALADGTADKDTHFRLLAVKASVQLSQHNFAEAKSTAEAAVAINPYNAQIYGALVDANVELGDYATAVAMADQMVSIRPDLRSYSRVSYLREIHGDVSGAIEAMEMAVAAGYPGLEATSWARLTLGQLYEHYGKANQAEAQYQLALKERPNYPFALERIAQLRANEEKYAEAEKILLEAAAIIPEVGFYQSLADIYQQTGNTDKLKTVRQDILTMLEEDVDSGHNMNLEYAYHYLEHYGEAERALPYAQAEYEKRPDNIDVNRLLARIHQQMGKDESARLHTERAARTSSRHPELIALQRTLAMK